MRFRLSGGTLLVFVLAAGCGLKAFDKAPDRTPIKIDGVPAGCLSGLPDKIGGYLDGTRPASDVQALGDCIDQALTTFETKTRGKRPNSYSSEELRSFLNRFFTQDSPLPGALFEQLMKIKKAVVGGDATCITKNELRRSREIFKTLTSAIIHLAPVSPDTVRPFTQRLAGILEESRQSYELSQADSLFNALEPWVSSPNPATRTARAVRQARESLPWAHAGYGLLFPQAGQAEEIRAKDWPAILDIAADAYEIFWKADQARAQESWHRGQGREGWVGAVRLVRGTLLKVAARSPEGLIPWTAIERAIETVYPEKLELFGSTVRVSSLEQAISVSFGKAFGPGRGQAAPGIDSALLDRLLAAVEKFSETQAFLEEKFKGHGSGRVAPRELFGTRFPELAAVTATYPGSLDPRGSGEMVLPGSWREVPYGLSLAEYEDALWRELLSEILFHGYAGMGSVPPAMVPRTLKESELVQFYQDARPLGLDLKIFDPADTSAPNRRFRDARLFFFSSDGDEALTLPEMAELIRYMLSGKRLGDDMHRAIARDCTTGAVDPYGFLTVETTCYQREYYGRAVTFLASLPGLKRYYLSLAPAEQAEYGKLVEFLARKKADPMAWFDSDDSESIATFTEYIETFFTRFDRDGDGMIGGQELDLVYSVVDAPLKQYACVKNSAVRRAVFNYLIRYGKPPERSVRDTARFLALWGTEVFQYFKADRLQLLRIFSELAKLQSGESTSCD